MANYRKNPNPTKATGGLPPVTPLEVDRIRRSALDVVRKNIHNVRKVLEGQKVWSNQQVRLFGMMLNKVMPDLHHSFNEHSVELKDVHELSIQELEAIALQAKTMEAEYAAIIEEEIKPDPGDPTSEDEIDATLTKTSKVPIDQNEDPAQ